MNTQEVVTLNAVAARRGVGGFGKADHDRFCPGQPKQSSADKESK